MDITREPSFFHEVDNKDDNDVTNPFRYKCASTKMIALLIRFEYQILSQPDTPQNKQQLLRNIGVALLAENAFDF